MARADGRTMRKTLLFARYSAAGVINTAVGYAVIFGGMLCGLGPVISNALGYCVGFVVSFVQARSFVFRSQGRVVGDAIRFIPAFLAAFVLNLLTLRGLIERGVNPYVAQLGACFVFLGAGFFLNYLFVFRKRNE